MYARRTIVKGLAGLPPIAAILADPILRRAVAQTLDAVTAETPSGRTVSAALALPERTPAPGVLLVHEWWGLNDQIKSMAAELAREGYVALAVDLFGGEVAETPQEAQRLTQELDPERATETLTTWVDWLRGHEATTDRVATVGWCFGGGWSLRASLAAPVDATVIYYGQVPSDPERLRSLQGPVLGHFGSQDQFVDPETVQGFERALEQAGVPHDIHVYDADHAFANPTGDAYDREDAQLAWRRTLDFLKTHLRA